MGCKLLYIHTSGTPILDFTNSNKSQVSVPFHAVCIWDESSDLESFLNQSAEYSRRGGGGWMPVAHRPECKHKLD
jgi:hypothetical protein